MEKKPDENYMGSVRTTHVNTYKTYLEYWTTLNVTTSYSLQYIQNAIARILTQTLYDHIIIIILYYILCIIM